MVAVAAAGFQLFVNAEGAASGADRLPELRRDLASRSGDLARTESLRATEKDPAKLADYAGRVAQLQTTIEGIHSDIDHLPPAFSREPLSFALSLLSQKIGAVALLLFGLQILVSLYRYTAKLADLCESRADFLQVLPEDAAASVDVLKAALLDDRVDFEQPKVAGRRTMRVVETVRDVAHAAAKRTGSG
jgi:hypothetical protein